MKYDLKGRRTSLGLTQAQVSRISGISVPLIQKLEYGDGNPSLDTLRKLGQALGFEVKIEPTKPNWPLLIKAGIPLTGYPTYESEVTLYALLIEFTNAWREDLDSRHREALAAMLLSLQTHYPSVWKRHFSGFTWEDLPELHSGRVLKLSRLCLAKLQHIL